MSFDLPALPDGWQYISLEALSQEKSITYGVVQPGTAVSDGIPIIRVNNFKDGRLDLSDVMHIAPEVESKYGRTRLAGGEVLLTIVGSVGQVAVVPRSLNGFNVARAVAVIHPIKEVSANWIAICLRSPLAQHLLGSRANTTVQATINLKDLRALPVPIPPVAIRQAIEDLIYSLDDRIALLRETNATLEAMAQALFKSWFVDFDPVHANAGTRAATLPAELQALFPSTFTDTSQGLVPAGWRVGTIADFAELNPESWTTKKHPAKVAYIDLANAKDNVIADIAEFDFDAAPSRARRVLRDGDTIVGTVRPGNRSFAFIQDAAENLTGSTGFAVLRPKHQRNTAFIYLAATNDNSIDHLTHVADGGAYPAVRPEVVASLTCTCPPPEVLDAFNDVAAELLMKIAKNHQQAQTLATLRDTLLPRLISGQLRLPDVVAALAEVDA